MGSTVTVRLGVDNEPDSAPLNSRNWQLIVLR
jgi:hypothetical protein